MSNVIKLPWVDRVVKFPEQPPPKKPVCELWDADPTCEHDVREARGGGVKCSKCRGWYCL